MNGKAIVIAGVSVCAFVVLIVVLNKSEATNEKAQVRALKSSPPAEPRYELVHIALLVRHTVRAPRQFPPNDSILNEALFPRGVARSTRRGLAATRNATLIWSEWYKDFLAGNNPNEVFARSSQADRCYETLSMILNTWYPSPDDIPLSQVAIRMPLSGSDKYVEHCGQMKYITRDYDPNTKIPDDIYREEGFRTVGDYVAFLKNKTGLHNESVNFFYMAYMEGFVSVEYETSLGRDDHWMLRYTRTREFSRLYLLHNSINVVGPYYGHHMLNGIANALERAAARKSQYKLTILAYHDLNLLSVLRAIGIADRQTEPLAAIGFELWQNQQRSIVRLRFSQGLTLDWQYKTYEYLQIKNRTNQTIDELGQVVELIRGFYRNDVNLTNCGYFGNDAKI